ncbi:MAG: rubrerythrin family protein, partial [Thermoplasmata archaeon]
EENLQSAMDGEDFEVHWMYPAYHEISHLEEEKGAQRAIHYALEAEKIHSRMYEEAKNVVEKEDEDIELDDVYICPVCGYTHEGTPPDKCPVCGAKKETFKKFD